MVNSKLIGERVREARMKENLSQDELAEQLGIRQAMISQVENGIKIPNTQLMNALADILRVTTDFLNGRN